MMINIIKTVEGEDWACNIECDDCHIVNTVIRAQLRHLAKQSPFSPSLPLSFLVFFSQEKEQSQPVSPLTHTHIVFSTVYV